MNINNFQAGIYKKEYKYKSFSPSKINKTFVWEDPIINTMLEDATRALGELNAFTKIVPNVDIFIHMHITKEANKSSKIEGTKTDLSEVIVSKEHIEPEKRDDWQEVQNYIEAMNFSLKQLNKTPLSNKLLKQIHSILLNTVRGNTKLPGEFRTSQNWIGGSSINTASFIPPNHNEIAELMGDLELFIHNKNVQVPHLIKIAIIHYQFETIHPFLDGNGRIGRLLITLYLVDIGLLSKPSLYLSDFIEKNKLMYYELLTNVRVDNDLMSWIKFFLEAVIQTASSGVETFTNILSLKNDMDKLIISFRRKASNASKLIDYLYMHPIITISEVVSKLNISKQTASVLVKEFEKREILREITGFQRNKLFIFDKYLKIYSQS